MKRHFNFLLVLLLSFYCFSAGAQNVKVEASLNKVAIPIGDQTVLHISAQFPFKTDIAFPQVVDSIGKIQIVRSLKPDTLFDKNHPNLETITHNYVITCFDTGVYVLPEFTLHTKSGDYQTSTLTLQVTSVKVDTTKGIYDIKQPLAVSFGFWDWLKDHWVGILIAYAIIFLIAGLIIYFKKRRKNEVPVIKAVPIVPIETIALNKLYELRDKKLWQQDEVKLYYSELTDVLREYLEKRYQVKAHEQTTDEIFDGLKRKDIQEDSRNTLRQILMLADLVKFAKQKPIPVENEQSMENAISFIVQTRPEVKPAVQKEDLPK